MSFRHIFGHERQIRQLKCAVAARRIPHSYLFHGIRGIGKWTMARQFAKYLYCRQGGDDACDTCSSCRKIDHEGHADIDFVAPERGMIKLDQIRTIQHHARVSPLEGTKRLFIIDDADCLNEEAANALLKILEEPGAAAMFILVSARQYQLPQTVLSRCQKVAFAPLNREVIESYLRETRGYDRDTAFLLAAQCGGSIGMALSIDDAAFLENKNALIETLVQADCAHNLTDLMNLTEFFGSTKETIMDRLAILHGWYRDVLVFRESGRTDDIINQDILETVASMADRLPGCRAIEALNHVERAMDAIEKNVNKQLTLETMVFKLSHLVER